MACCKCCCGGIDCADGQVGKCCCGGASGTCCQTGEYCCSGACQSTPCDNPPPLETCSSGNSQGSVGTCQTNPTALILKNGCPCPATVTVWGAVDDDILFNGVVYQDGDYAFFPPGGCGGVNGGHFIIPPYVATVPECETLEVGVRDNGFGGGWDLWWTIECDCECCAAFVGTSNGNGEQSLLVPAGSTFKVLNFCWTNTGTPQTFTLVGLGPGGSQCGQCLVIGPVEGSGCACFEKPEDCASIYVTATPSNPSGTVDWEFNIDPCCVGCDCCGYCNEFPETNVSWTYTGSPCCEGTQAPDRVGVPCNDTQIQSLVGSCHQWADELLPGSLIGRECDSGDPVFQDPCVCMERQDSCQEYKVHCCENATGKRIRYRIFSQVRRWLFRYNSCDKQWEKVGQLPSANVISSQCYDQTCGTNPPECDCPAEWEGYMCNPGQYADDNCDGPFPACVGEFP